MPPYWMCPKSLVCTLWADRLLNEMVNGVNLYNTSTVWNSNGKLIARHRNASRKSKSCRNTQSKRLNNLFTKHTRIESVHLCDIHLENEIDIVEVDKLTAGNDVTTFQVNGFKCGVAICYDANFDEFVKIYGKAGEFCFLLIRETLTISCYEATHLHRTMFGIHETNY